MTAKLSDLCVQDSTRGGGQTGVHSHLPLIRRIDLPELLDMLEAEGVLRREKGFSETTEGFWKPDKYRLVTDWRDDPPQGESDDSAEYLKAMGFALAEDWDSDEDAAWLPREESSDE